jgi:hypothetical protein
MKAMGVEIISLASADRTLPHPIAKSVKRSGSWPRKLNQVVGPNALLNGVLSTSNELPHSGSLRTSHSFEDAGMLYRQLYGRQRSGARAYILRIMTHSGRDRCQTGELVTRSADSRLFAKTSGAVSRKMSVNRRRLSYDQRDMFSPRERTLRGQKTNNTCCAKKR